MKGKEDEDDGWKISDRSSGQFFTQIFGIGVEKDAVICVKG